MRTLLYPRLREKMLNEPDVMRDCRDCTIPMNSCFFLTSHPDVEKMAIAHHQPQYHPLRLQNLDVQTIIVLTFMQVPPSSITLSRYQTSR